MKKKYLDLISWSIFLFFLIFTILLVYQSLYEPTIPEAKDFIAFWSAAKLSALGRPEDAYNIAKMAEVVGSASSIEQGFSWLYPPTFQAIALPLSLLTYPTAFILFSTCTFLMMLIALIYFSRRELLLPIITAPTLFIAVTFGQNSMLTAALGITAITLIQKKPVFSGICIGILSIKPHLFVLLPLFAIIEKQWKTLGYAIATTIFLLLLSIILLGPSPWCSFFENVPMAPTWLQNGVLPTDLMTSIAANMLNFGFKIKSAIIIHTLNLIIVSISTITAFKLTKNINLRGAAIIVLTLNLSPYMYTYELTWLTAALALLLIERSWKRNHKIIMIGCWIFPLIDFIQNIIYEKSFSLTFLISYLLLYIIIQRAREERLQLTHNLG